MIWIATGLSLSNGDVLADPLAAKKQHREALEDLPVLHPEKHLARSPGGVVWRGLHQSVQVNVDDAGLNFLGDAANEPSLAIDPTNPDNLVIGWRHFDSIVSNFRQAGYAYSHDGGKTWTFGGVVDPGRFRSDPVLAANSRGEFFYYSISSTFSAEMAISLDKGATWSEPIPARGGDKIWMTADAGQGIGSDHIYAIWNSQFTCCGEATDFSRSVDLGLTYEEPLAMPEKLKWGTVDVGTRGEVLIAGARVTDFSFPFPHIFIRSGNAKRSSQTPTFDLVTGLDLGGVTPFGGIPNPGGLVGQVWVVADRSMGPTRGNIYVLASVDPVTLDPLDVMFIRSTDGGETWSEPIRVNHDTDQDKAWQWFGTISVGPKGRIDVIWNDTIRDPSDLNSEVFYSYSTDAGATWSAGLPVTPRWNSTIGYPRQNKIGDYYQMISDQEGASLAYSATFNGEQDIYFLRVGDCNANGQHDSKDIAKGSSLDVNADGIPDECEEAPPPACATDVDCDDGLFCNGTEQCDGDTGGCLPGIPATCADGDLCTLDLCETTTDSCVFVPTPTPGPVAETLGLSHDQEGGISRISWQPVSAAATYNSYRGSIPFLTMGFRPSMGLAEYDHHCFERGNVSEDGLTVSQDEETPLLGETFYYLVESLNGCAESDLGQAPDGTHRPRPFPCPPVF